MEFWHTVTDQGVDDLNFGADFQLSHSPFLDKVILYRKKLENKIPKEPYKQGSLYLACRFGLRCRCKDLN